MSENVKKIWVPDPEEETKAEEDLGAAGGRGTQGEDQSGSPHADHRV